MVNIIATFSCISFGQKKNKKENKAKLCNNIKIVLHLHRNIHIDIRKANRLNSTSFNFYLESKIMSILVGVVVAVLFKLKRATVSIKL